jgi:hypothetical protein
LLLGIVDCSPDEIPADIRAWFGFVKSNRVAIDRPSEDQRQEFFSEVIAGVKRPPNEFPDAMPRKKRVLEDLPKAPPPPPRQPSEAELQLQLQSDARLREYVKFRLGPVLAELKRRYKRFSKPIGVCDPNDPLLLRAFELTGLVRKGRH